MDRKSRGVCASVRQLCSVGRLSSVHLWAWLSVSVLPVSPSAYQPLGLLAFLLSVCRHLMGICVQLSTPPARGGPVSSVISGLHRPC